MDGDLYAVLGVSPDASQKDITKAFRQHARKLHPDKQPPGASEEEKQKAKAGFQRLGKAYETLNDPEKRKTYDLTRSSTTSQAQARWTPASQDNARSAPQAGPWRRTTPSSEFTSSDDGDDRVWMAPAGPKEKTLLEKEIEENERRRRQQNAFGANWVSGSNAPTPKLDPSRFSDWVASGAPEESESSGSAISYLRGVDLAGLDCSDDEDEEETAGWGHEVWRPGPAKQAPAAAPQDAEPAAGPAASSAPAVPKPETAKPKSGEVQPSQPCCAVS